jgi:hypothetical protein
MSPASVQVSWATNFPIGSWQLMYTTNLLPANWQPVPQAPSLAGDALSVLIPFADSSGYYRLQQVGGGGGGGGCTFQAAPGVITAGQSSTLTWCPQDGTTYTLSPGPGMVTGSSFPVSPTVTTVYSLTASNASGFATDFATVIVGPCGWLQVKNWDAKLYFTFGAKNSTKDYNFTILHQVGLVDDITFHLTPQVGSTMTDAYYFGTATGGKVSITDHEDDKTGPVIYTTDELGSGPPEQLISSLSLHLTCNSYDFSYNVVMNHVTEASDFGVFDIYEGVGTGAMASRPLEGTNSVIHDDAFVPAQYPPVSAEYFTPSSDLGKTAFTTKTLPSTPQDSLDGKAYLQFDFKPTP